MATATINDAPDLLASVQDLLVRLKAAAVTWRNADQDRAHTEPHLGNVVRSALEQQLNWVATAERLAGRADQAPAAELARKVFPFACEVVAAMIDCRGSLPAGVPRPIRDDADRTVAAAARAVRTLIEAWPDLGDELPDDLMDEVWTFRRTPLAYLRTVANLLWCTIRHPFSDTAIDWETGRILYHTR